MRCTYLNRRWHILGRLFRDVCNRPATVTVKVWAKPPLFGREPDWQAPRCEDHRLLDMERLLADRVVDIPISEEQGALW